MHHRRRGKKLPREQLLFTPDITYRTLSASAIKVLFLLFNANEPSTLYSLAALHMPSKGALSRAYAIKRSVVEGILYINEYTQRVFFLVAKKILKHSLTGYSALISMLHLRQGGLKVYSQSILAHMFNQPL